MGNCGVGFAPVRPGAEDRLVELMESVEDIPGTALHDGIPWGWESFAEYLDGIDTPYAVDVGTQAPHVAMRLYVMGERCYDDATPEDMAEMRRLTRAALEAGALGVLHVALLRARRQGREPGAGARGRRRRR